MRRRRRELVLQPVTLLWRAAPGGLLQLEYQIPPVQQAACPGRLYEIGQGRSLHQGVRETDGWIYYLGRNS